MKKTVVVAALLMVACSSADNSGKPESEAAEWATQLGIKDAKVSCSRVDSDNDGYVSCSVMSGTQLYALECLSSQTSLGCSQDARGCKVAQPKVNVSQSTTVVH